jgi:heptosyltransferase-2
LLNRRANNTPNKDWPHHHWGQLTARLLNRYTIVEIGTGPEQTDSQWHPNYVNLTGKLPLDAFLAAVAASDIHVGPISGPVHVAAAAGKPSVIVYGGYEHPDCSSYPGNVNLYTQLSCSPCWLLHEPCPYDRVCLSRILPEQVEQAIESFRRGGSWDSHGVMENLPGRSDPGSPV